MAELKRHGRDYMAQQWHTCSYDHLALYRDLCLPCSTIVFCPYVSQVCRKTVSQRVRRGMFMETRSWEQLLWENEGRKCSGSCQEELGWLFKTVSTWNKRAGFVVKHLEARFIPWAECFSEAVFRLEVSSEPSSAKQQAAMGGCRVSAVVMKISHSEDGVWVELSFSIFVGVERKNVFFHNIYHPARKSDFWNSYSEILFTSFNRLSTL